jgi:polysaccharide export outer membrane protein
MYYRLALSLFCAFLLFGGMAHADQAPAKPASVQAGTPATDTSYMLGPGDKIRVNVFGQPDLGGEYIIDGAGFVQLPLIGQAKAAGLTATALQKDIAAKFGDGYLVNPSIDVQVVAYRPFYIIGEVKAPGQYAYVNGMSILNAVALAGGFTDRADKSEVYIRRNGSSKEEDLPTDETTKVNPGDIVRISERFF